ncbi:MAG: hypothetical protein JSV33_16100 [bacterium]|nr:MAG: hypothetical protein JSV33_16100 [bacterium]
MARNTRILVILFVAMFTIPLVFSQPAVGRSSRGGTFLPLGWDARGEGLGGAATILIRDDRSAYWNPANLTFMKHPRLSIGVTRPVPDLENLYSIVSIGTGLLDARTEPDEPEVVRRFGTALTVTHLSLNLAAGSKWSESTIGISGAYAPNTYNSVGFTGRLLKSWTDIEDADSWGFALDVGWTARLTRRIWLGVVGRNVVSSIKYPERDESLDPTWNFALAYEDLFDRVSTECDAVLKNSDIDRFLAGMEITVWKDVLFVLGGLDHRFSEGKRTILHMGFGSIYRFSEVAVTFTFDPEDAFGRKTRASVGFSF